MKGSGGIPELTARGGVGSFTGIITYKNAVAVRAAARAQGLERFMVETDAPYLTPVPHRGKRNEPSYVKFVAEKVAQIKGLDVAEVEKITMENARKLFRI